MARKQFPIKKPYPTFPLTPRADGRFAKKIKGEAKTFGRDGDWREALNEYLIVARQLHAGSIVPHQPTGRAPTVRQLVNRYLDTRRLDVSAGMLELGTWDDYREALTSFARFVGPSIPATELAGEHLDRFARHLMQVKKFSPSRYHIYRANVRAMLNYAFNAKWLVRWEFGHNFKRIPKSKLRQKRRSRMAEPAHVRLLVDAATDPQLRAMIYLALNGGFGNTDCANLPRDSIDLARGVIDYKRSKTGAKRLVPLWPATARELAPLLQRRPDDVYVFRTKFGNLWVRTTENKRGTVVTKDSIAQAFSALVKSFCPLDEHRRGTFADIYPHVKFYALRHIHRTFADEARDQHAAYRIMGHEFPGMSDVYVEHVSVERLRAVVNHVYRRVFDSEPT